jgi:iron complex transport system substrate-binding protein
VNVERLAALRPHLIITQGLCDVCAVSESEARAAAIRIPGSPRVLSLSPLLMADIFSDIRNVGRAVGRAAVADRLVTSMEARIRRIRGTVDRLRPLRVTLLEWLDPPYACGHWNPELVAWAGGVEGHSRAGARSRRMDWDEIHAWDPEALIIASCGMTSEEARAQLSSIHRHWEGLRCAREGRVFVSDGKGHFSRPGPRLVDSLEWLAGVLHFEKGFRGSPAGPEDVIFQR